MVKNAILWRLRNNSGLLPDTSRLVFTSLNAVHRFFTTQTKHKWFIREVGQSGKQALTLGRLREAAKVKPTDTFLECEIEFDKTVNVCSCALIQLEIFP